MRSVEYAGIKLTFDNSTLQWRGDIDGVERLTSLFNDVSADASRNWSPADGDRAASVFYRTAAVFADSKITDTDKIQKAPKNVVY